MLRDHFTASGRYLVVSSWLAAGLFPLTQDQPLAVAGCVLQRFRDLETVEVTDSSSVGPPPLPMTIAPGIPVPDAEVAAICKRYQVRKLSVFGSAARGEMRSDSDVDLLVDFHPDARIGLLELGRLWRSLPPWLAGCLAYGDRAGCRPPSADRRDYAKEFQ